MISELFFGNQNAFNNLKTTDIIFLISRKFEVTIIHRKSGGLFIKIIYRNEHMPDGAKYGPSSCKQPPTISNHPGLTLTSRVRLRPKVGSK